jgi:RimJ/RimL family protein N-acetyltransferase
MKKIIETERLYLRELTMEDTHELAKVLSNPEAMSYYDAPLDQEK